MHSTLYEIVCRRGPRCAARAAHQIHCVECQYVAYVKTDRNACHEDVVKKEIKEETKEEIKEVTTE